MIAKVRIFWLQGTSKSRLCHANLPVLGAHVCMYACMSVFVCMYVCMCWCMYGCVCVYVYVYVCICIWFRICVCSCVGLRVHVVCVSVCVCVCVHIYVSRGYGPPHVLLCSPLHRRSTDPHNRSLRLSGGVLQQAIGESQRLGLRFVARHWWIPIRNRESQFVQKANE